MWCRTCAEEQVQQIYVTKQDTQHVQIALSTICNYHSARTRWSITCRSSMWRSSPLSAAHWHCMHKPAGLIPARIVDMKTDIMAFFLMFRFSPLPQKAKIKTDARVPEKKNRNRGPKKRGQKKAPSREVFVFGYSSRGAGKWPHFSCSGNAQKIKKCSLPRLPAATLFVLGSTRLALFTMTGKPTELCRHSEEAKLCTCASGTRLSPAPCSSAC